MVRFLFHTLNIVLSCTLNSNPPSKFSKDDFPIMSSADHDLIRNWAKSHGKCVRQRTVRQETTKYRAGTLPLNMYQTAVQRGERLEFVPVENEHNEEQLESVSREEGREVRVCIERSRRRSTVRIRHSLLRQ